MERRKFIRACCYGAIGVPIVASVLQSCEALHYAIPAKDANGVVIKKSEFWRIKENKKVHRSFVLIKMDEMGFPICLYKIEEDNYIASLMYCTHRGCELTIGGGVYSCPCHGSEFSMTGKVLEGPADEDLKTFKTTTDDEHIYVHMA